MTSSCTSTNSGTPSYYNYEPFFVEVCLIMIPFFCFSYFSNISSFPQPLSAEEEKYYLDLYKNGSEEAKNILIERNLRLVAHIVKKYSNLNNDMDDLISIGTIGLIKGITSFDVNKCTRLATYAARCIENAILTLRKHFPSCICSTRAEQNNIYILTIPKNIINNKFDKSSFSFNSRGGSKCCSKRTNHFIYNQIFITLHICNS